MNEEIIAYIKNELNTEPTLEINSFDDLLESGVVDSLGMMRLILFLEKQSKRRVPAKDMTLDNFRTVEKIANYFSA